MLHLSHVFALSKPPYPYAATLLLFIIVYLPCHPLEIKLYAFDVFTQHIATSVTVSVLLIIVPYSFILNFTSHKGRIILKE